MSERQTEARAQCAAAAVRYAEAWLAFWETVRELEAANVEERASLSAGHRPGAPRNVV